MGFEGFAFHPVWNLGDYQKANAVFTEARLQAPNKDLSECVDEEGFVYSIEKYCYSSVGSSVVVDHVANYQIRIQSVAISLVYDIDTNGTLHYTE